MDYLQALSHSIITQLQVLNPLILTGMATVFFWLVLSYHNSGAWKLRQFPTVGSSLPILSFIGKINFVMNTKSVVSTGRQMWPGRIFKVLAPMGWYVVISDSTHVNDIRRAPDHLLSANKFASELLQTRFTLKSQMRQNHLHMSIMRTRLTKEIPALIADVYDEVVEACNQFIPVNDEWTGVVAHENMTTIVARAANRIFVGPVLCKNPDWIKHCINFTVDVFKTAMLLNFAPSFLRPLLFYFASGKVAQRNHDGLELLKPFIAARRNEGKGEGTGEFNDFLTWLINEGEGEDVEDWSLAVRTFGLNFVAIHTSSMAVTHALFDLTSNAEYIEPLREEVEEVTKREGWTKAALDQMCKVDSFLKESQRLHPVGVLLMGRYTLRDFTFSDGTFIPAGTVVGVPSDGVQLDPQTYEDPLRFDGFRFVKMKERAALQGHPDKNFDVVTINSDFVAFGQGRHACPGRFFASAEIKLVLAHIINTYDVKLMDGARPQDSYYMNGIQPNPAAKVYFRRRQ